MSGEKVTVGGGSGARDSGGRNARPATPIHKQAPESGKLNGREPRRHRLTRSLGRGRRMSRAMLLVVAQLLAAVTSDVLHGPAPKLPGRARLGADKDGGPTGTIGDGRDKS